MTEVQFYHLLSTPLEKALPKLMEKALAGKLQSVIKVADDEMAARLDEALWATDSASFIPHGLDKDSHADKQPIVISQDGTNPNGAKVLVVTDGSYQEQVEGYDKLLDMFDGHNPAEVQAARLRWKQYKEQGAGVSYIQQQKDGSWKKMA